MSKSWLALLLMASALVILGWTCLGEENIELLSQQDSAGKKVATWSVSVEVFRKQPSWDPASQEIALSPHEAVEKANAWFQKQTQTTNAPTPLSVTLRRRATGQEVRWLYSLNFRPTRLWSRYDYVIVLLDGTVVEPRQVSTNAVVSSTWQGDTFVSNNTPTTSMTHERVPFRQGDDAAITNRPKMPISMKGGFETVEAKILKVFTAEDNGARFRAYLVKWKEFDVIVSDALSRSDRKEGELITFLANHTEFPLDQQRPGILSFQVLDFHPPQK